MHANYPSPRHHPRSLARVTLNANMRAFYSAKKKINTIAVAAVHSIEKLQLWLICVHFVF